MKQPAPLTPGTTVALLLPDLRGGGAERVMLTLATELSKSGIAPHMVLARADGTLLVDALQLGVPVTDLRAQRLRHVVVPLRRWLNRHRPSALIAAMWPLTCLAIWAARGTGVPVVTTDHATLSDQYAQKGVVHRMMLRASIRATYPKALANISVSVGAAQDLEQLGRLGKNGVQVIHNPVPKPAGNPNAAVWPAQARHRILAVGNLRWQKDFPTLLRAFRLLQDRGCDCELVILGDGSDRAGLSELIAALDLGKCVSLPGYVANVGDYYASADLFVLSSCSEGFANVIVEALSHGLPVVATNCPHGPAEILSHGRFGRLVPAGDHAAMAAGMHDALRHPLDREILIRRAREFAPPHATRKFLSLLSTHNISNPEFQ